MDEAIWRPRTGPRYAMVRSDSYKDGNSLYDVVDNGWISGGTERVLAPRVRYEAAKEITDALNLSYSVQQNQRDDEPTALYESDEEAR